MQIYFIRPAHSALHTLYFRAIIYLPLYLTCFFLFLQFKQKIDPQQPQLPAPAAGADDDVDDASVPSSTPETAHPPPAPTASSSSTTPAAAVPSTSGVSKSSKKKGCTTGDPDIVQLLLQQQERSQAAAGELRQLVTQAAEPANNKSAWGSFLNSNLPQVHDCVWSVYLKMEMENYIWSS